MEWEGWVLGPAQCDIVFSESQSAEGKAGFERLDPQVPGKSLREAARQCGLFTLSSPVESGWGLIFTLYAPTVYESMNDFHLTRPYPYDFTKSQLTPQT